MIFSLIGMSGTGKSYWSKKLAQQGFIRFGCDDLIEEKLGQELKTLGYKGIQDVAKWMGQPYDIQYPQTSKRYLQLEIAVMHEIFEKIMNIKNKDVVIDTTGSVIYTGTTTIEELKKLTKVVYLETPKTVQHDMYLEYIQNPKPVIWGNMFVKEDTQTNAKALEICYPTLLLSRTKIYEQLADMTFSYHRLRENDYSINEFINRMYEI